MGRFLYLLLFFFSLGSSIPIRDVQFTLHPSGDSPYNGKEVTISGIVTAGSGVFSKNIYFLQDSPGPWNGIMVYDQLHTVARGDRITITGTVSEYYGMTEVKDIKEFIWHGSGYSLPSVSDVSTDSVNTEVYEGVLVRVDNVMVVNHDLEYGEWMVDDGAGGCRIDDRAYYTYKPGYNQFLSSITGVVDYSYGNFKIQPRGNLDIEGVFIINGPRIVWLNKDSVAIYWSTAWPSRSEICYGIGSFSDTLSSDSLLRFHSLSLGGLKPSTKYSYQVFSEDDKFLIKSSAYEFRTPAEGPELFSFITLGDAQGSDAYDAISDTFKIIINRITRHRVCLKSH